MEFPKRGVNRNYSCWAYTTASATQDLSCVCDLHHRSQQHWIPNPLSEARDRTRILVDASQVRYHWVTTGIQRAPFWRSLFTLLGSLEMSILRRVDKQETCSRAWERPAPTPRGALVDQACPPFRTFRLVAPWWVTDLSQDLKGCCFLSFMGLLKPLFFVHVTLLLWFSWFILF